MSKPKSEAAKPVIWLSIDPAKSSGVAFWNNEHLISSTIIKPRGGKGLYYAYSDIYPSRLEAWGMTYSRVSMVIIERGMGNRPTAVRSQGKHIGWHECMCAQFGIPSPTEVNVSEWRRVIKEDQNVSYPKDSIRCKALSVQLVKKLYDKDVIDDEAEAILIGRAALRMGLVRL